MEERGKGRMKNLTEELTVPMWSAQQPPGSGAVHSAVSVGFRVGMAALGIRTRANGPVLLLS